METSSILAVGFRKVFILITSYLELRRVFILTIRINYVYAATLKKNRISERDFIKILAFVRMFTRRKRLL